MLCSMPIRMLEMRRLGSCWSGVRACPVGCCCGGNVCTPAGASPCKPVSFYPLISTGAGGGLHPPAFAHDGGLPTVGAHRGLGASGVHPERALCPWALFLATVRGGLRCRIPRTVAGSLWPLSPRGGCRFSLENGA